MFILNFVNTLLPTKKHILRFYIFLTILIAIYFKNTIIADLSSLLTDSISGKHLVSPFLFTKRHDTLYAILSEKL